MAASHEFGSQTEVQGEKEQSAIIHISLFLDCGGNVTCGLVFLLPPFPHHDGPEPPTVGQHKPFLYMASHEVFCHSNNDNEKESNYG